MYLQQAGSANGFFTGIDLSNCLENDHYHGKDRGKRQHSCMILSAGLKLFFEGRTLRRHHV
jgi:hypothetical protein